MEQMLMKNHFEIINIDEFYSMKLTFSMMFCIDDRVLINSKMKKKNKLNICY